MTAGHDATARGGRQGALNIIICGGTGAGKTTLLNALSGVHLAEDERIVTIEDAAELQLQQPHVARLETRPAQPGRPAARCASGNLLINSLRMRPDRIVVGEVRGEEALDMLQAMNTGHDGSLTTVHANSPRDAVARLEVMVSLANSNMQLVSIRQQIAAAVHLLVQASRMSDGTRRVINITEVTGMEGEIVTLQDIFVFEKRGLTPEGKVIGRFAATGIRPKFYEKLAGCRHPVAQRNFRRSCGRLGYGHHAARLHFGSARDNGRWAVAGRRCARPGTRPDQGTVAGQGGRHREAEELPAIRAGADGEWRYQQGQAGRQAAAQVPADGPIPQAH